MSQNKRFRASIIVWRMLKSLSTLEIRAKLADIGLASFARGSVAPGRVTMLDCFCCLRIVRV